MRPTWHLEGRESRQTKTKLKRSTKQEQIQLVSTSKLRDMNIKKTVCVSMHKGNSWGDVRKIWKIGFSQILTILFEQYFYYDSFWELYFALSRFHFWLINELLK